MTAVKTLDVTITSQKTSITVIFISSGKRQYNYMGGMENALSNPPVTTRTLVEDNDIVLMMGNKNRE